MNLNYLDFEQPIAELEAKIEELRLVTSDTINISEEIEKLQAKSLELTKSIFANLSAWQVAMMARHPLRPYSQDYIAYLFDDFDELYGDRHFRDDTAVICGFGKFKGETVCIIGQQKGRDTKEKIRRNFGMMHPEGYRKALRIMKLAEKYSIPIFTFIDTPGAYPGIRAEERNQSEAIARNLHEMARLKTPIISIVTGEGCSGGALGIGVADCILMLQYAYYSVISPEGCASILWKSAEKAQEAAEAMAITAPQLKKFGLIDDVIEEPLGGAHRDVEKMAYTLGYFLEKWLKSLRNLSLEKLLARRYERLMQIGK